MRLGGAAAAIFPSAPERHVYNNALLDRGMAQAERRAAVAAVEEAFATAGLPDFAAWVHESDLPMREELGRSGYAVAESTRAMGMLLAGLSINSDKPVASLPWQEYLDFLWSEGVPAGLLRGVDPHAFRALGVPFAGETVSAALAYDHDGDCGIYNLGTRTAVRRRGLASALIARHLSAAAERECSTASVQSTPMAEGVYGRAGFRDLGRFLEFRRRRKA